MSSSRDQNTVSFGSYSKSGLLAAALSLTAGCSQQPSNPERQGEAVHAEASGQVVIDWNSIAFDVASRADGYKDLFPHLRAITMMHLAMHDAVNCVSSKYDRYALTACDGRGNPIAAAAAAAHGVLSSLYPEQRVFLDTKLNESLADQRQSAATADRALALGEAAANAILRSREADGSDASGQYSPRNEPGRYQFVPPFDFVYRPAWRNVKPFALHAVDQFRSVPPPAIESEAYAADYEEVKTYGRATASSRTPEQTYYAAFWYELSDIGWNRIARVTWSNQPKRDLWFTARLFALLNASLMDSYVAGWDSKLHYDFWRPYTAIRAGEADRNPATLEEPGWEPYCVTPPVQDYPSTHSTLGAAGAAVLGTVYGRDVPFTMESTSSKPPGQKRSFSSFEKAASENADSRVACGIHFRSATRAGLELGKRIGAHASESILLPSRRDH